VESLRRPAPDYSSTVKAAVIYHTVQTNHYAPSESAALVRADYLYHVRSRGWNDIGYNLLVDRYGRVFEGRYGGITRAVLGAHAGGFNTYTTGVALLGTFSSSRPPAAMLASLKRLLAWKLDLTHVDPAGKTTLRSAGAPTSATRPGANIYGGRVSPGRVQPGRGKSVGVTARFSSKARWRVTVTGSNRATVRTFAGVGARTRVRWSGRTAAGTLPPPGWATVTVTAAGGVGARPAVSRVFVDRTAPPAGTSTGGFAKGVWRVNNVNAEQLSRSAGVFAGYRFGRAGDLPVVGDWDGDGTQTVGVVRPSKAAGTNRLLLRNSRGPVLSFTYGRYGDRVLVGDWDGNGTWTPGVLRGGTRWYLKNSFTGTTAAVGLAKQTPGTPVVGDWDSRP
jgi:N-acetylmuramoyl-L-alanine amidase